VPACFIRLGTAGDNPDTQSPVHTSRFDIDEGALPIGAALLARLAIQYLQNARS
jgi:amidohydrolase